MPEQRRNWKELLRCLVVVPLLLVSLHHVSYAQSWSGVDEAVVEKVAREHGREARRPLIDPGDGDLLLFVFLLAGACGGFAAGYYWRELFNRKD